MVEASNEVCLRDLNFATAHFDEDPTVTPSTANTNLKRALSRTSSPPSKRHHGAANQTTPARARAIAAAKAKAAVATAEAEADEATAVALASKARALAAAAEVDALATGDELDDAVDMHTNIRVPPKVFPASAFTAALLIIVVSSCRLSQDSSAQFVVLFSFNARHHR